MHYQLVAKITDFTPEELQKKLRGFMPVEDEAVHQYGYWKLSEYADFAAFCKAEGICGEMPYNITEQDGILHQYGCAFGGAIIELFDIATDVGYLFSKSSNLELKRFLLKFVFNRLWLTEGKLTYELNFPFSEFETNILSKTSKSNSVELTKPLEIKGLSGIYNKMVENDTPILVEPYISDKKNNGLDQKI